MNEFDHVYVGYFVDDNGGTHVDVTMNAKMAEHWQSLDGYVAHEEAIFRIPEEVLTNAAFAPSDLLQLLSPPPALPGISDGQEPDF